MTFQKIPACCIALQSLQQRYICSHIIPCVREGVASGFFIFIFSILTKCRHSLIGPWYITHVLIFLLPLSGQKNVDQRICSRQTTMLPYHSWSGSLGFFFCIFFFLLCPTKFNVYSTKHFCSISLALALAAWSPHDDLVCFVYRRRCTQQFPSLAAHDRTSPTNTQMRQTHATSYIYTILLSTFLFVIIIFKFSFLTPYTSTLINCRLVKLSSQSARPLKLTTISI